MTTRAPGLRAKLVILLLAFGVAPLAAAIAASYIVGRAVVLDQARGALRELSRLQAKQVSTELSRERLLLRTIAGRLPPLPQGSSRRPSMLSRALIQSLPEDGVFDGLRVVRADGGILAQVALRSTEPHWPAAAPAADWTEQRVVVHRDSSGPLAYLLAVRIGHGTLVAWLEGHVRTEDFQHLFSIPEHMLSYVETGIFERAGLPVSIGHPHAEEELTAAMARLGDDSAVPAGALGLRRLTSLVAASAVAETDWVLVAHLQSDIALAPLERLRNSALLGCGVLVILIVFTGMAAARSVTRPLHELTAAATQFRLAGTHTTIASRAHDEVGELVRAFNRMAGDLQESRDEIERLHSRDLERAQQLAAVGELASGVAHEIRNPITGVLGALELTLRRLPEKDEARPLLIEAQTQLRRIETTTSQLLRYARPPEPRVVSVSVIELVRRTATIVEGRAHAEGVNLLIEETEDEVRVLADPELMVQVLVNLALNGIDAMSAGGKLTFWIARHSPHVWIGVRDTGPGIPPPRRADVFRPFFTTKHQGTGLGLSISHQIVSRHGGSLRLEDTPGGGATFIVALPLLEEPMVRP